MRSPSSFDVAAAIDLSAGLAPATGAALVVLRVRTSRIVDR